MPPRTNEYGQPIGEALADWSPRPLPNADRIAGRTCTLERLDPARHAESLVAAHAEAPDGRDWTYLPVGPFASAADHRAWLETAAASEDPRHYAVLDATGEAVGALALMRHDPANGAIEVGHVTFSPRMQRTVASTEAQFLLMRYVFDELGYRRYEWKCDTLNAPSMKAAARLGFTYEGTFRQAVVYKGRSRDTAWFSIIDAEWPDRRAEFERWLDPANFDGDGVQRTRLAHGV